MLEGSQNRSARMRAEVYGRVQGVGFRYFAQREATGLGLVGYVLNRWDGSVEVVAEGARAELEQFVSQLRSGPPASRVDRVDVDWGEARGDFRSFHVRY